jgi:O-antigen ligase
MIFCWYGLSRHHARRARLVLLVPLLVCGGALIATHSRGGLVAAAAGAAVIVSVRIGKRNTAVLALLCVLLLMFASLARQGSAGDADRGDTFQTRLELWSESFDVLRAAPLFGLGQGRLVEEIGQVTHNSFLHAYAEMGLFGGTAFFGCFYLLLRGLWVAAPTDPQLSRLRPYLLALLVAYAAGLLSLSRCYTVPTQFMLGLGTAFLAIHSRGGRNALPAMDLRCSGRVAGAGIVFLAATYVFLRLMLQRGTV